VTGLNCIVALKALSEETRMRILRVLADSPMTVAEVAQKLGLPQYNDYGKTNTFFR
jgi:DNA-binding transcriptional ArsR family regulator